MIKYLKLVYIKNSKILVYSIVSLLKKIITHLAQISSSYRLGIKSIKKVHRYGNFGYIFVPFSLYRGGARIVERKDLKRHLTPDNRNNGPSEE